MPDLNIAYIQFDIVWHDWSANRNAIESALQDVPDDVDILILPEMFASGFTMQPEQVAQGMNGESVAWMQQWARKFEAHILGSLVIRENETFYNRLIVAHPDGSVSYYDKRHLFTYADEHKHYSAGTHRLQFDVKGWQICPLVCYDLRFPVWSRNTTDFDVLIYVANWPSARADAWTALLKARSIENLCYTVGLNRVGEDANGLEYPGRSEVFDMGGHSVYRSNDQPDTACVTLLREPLAKFRGRYNFLADRDSYILD